MSTRAPPAETPQNLPLQAPFLMARDWRKTPPFLGPSPFIPAQGLSRAARARGDLGVGSGKAGGVCVDWRRLSGLVSGWPGA